MLSRVAENVYWLARYLERAEDTARLISVNSHLLLDFPRATRLGWATLVTITGSEDIFEKYYSEHDEESVLSFLCGDRRYSGSIISSLAAARENLRTTRDVMPRRIWEEVNQLYLTISSQVESGITSRNRDAFLNRVIRSCEAVNGMIAGTLSYTQTRTFLMLGRQIERADMTTRIIDVRSDNLLPRNSDDFTPFETLQWVSVLKSLTGFQMYRQHVRLRVRGPDVLRFLLQDQRFPRAVACCFTRISRELDTLPGGANAIAAADHCLQHLMQADVSLLASEPEGLHAFIDEIQIDISQLHNQIADTWFRLVEESRVLAKLTQTQSS
jgi:uncharacterized alpha-E superfamily protein